MYLTSHDDEFRAKRDDVLPLYYEAPPGEHIVCLDEMTGVQALERKYPDIPRRPGQPVLREFEYIRHGTRCLMGGPIARSPGTSACPTDGATSAGRYWEPSARSRIGRWLSR